MRGAEPQEMHRGFAPGWSHDARCPHGTCVGIPRLAASCTPSCCSSAAVPCPHDTVPPCLTVGSLQFQGPRPSVGSGLTPGDPNLAVGTLADPQGPVAPLLHPRDCATPMGTLSHPTVPVPFHAPCPTPQTRPTPWSLSHFHSPCPITLEPYPTP